jgi:hypothetical protein
MKKQNLKEGEEQIKRALLLMNYDTSKTLTENKINLSEQTGVPLDPNLRRVNATNLVTDQDLIGSTNKFRQWFQQVSDYGDLGFLNMLGINPANLLAGRRLGVKGVVDALDGFVDGEDLGYVMSQIASLEGKCYYDDSVDPAVNVPAIVKFLELYSEDEGGDDLISDINSVGTRTLPTGSEKLKKQIINKINSLKTQSCESSKSDESGGEDPWKNYPCVPKHPGAKEWSFEGAKVYEINGVTYFGNGRKKSNGVMSSYTCSDPPFNTTQQSYTYCEGPEFNLYCKNKKIKQLQACLGMEPKYQTGNFGPITSRNLTNIGYKDNKITSDQIDIICKRTNNTTSAINPATQYGTTTAPSIQGGISGGQQGVGDVEVNPNDY